MKALLFMFLVIAKIFLFTIWVAGFIIAKGFWSTLFCVFPFWSWYLVIENVMIHFSII